MRGTRPPWKHELEHQRAVGLELGVLVREKGEVARDEQEMQQLLVGDRELGHAVARWRAQVEDHARLDASRRRRVDAQLQIVGATARRRVLRRHRSGGAVSRMRIHGRAGWWRLRGRSIFLGRWCSLRCRRWIIAAAAEHRDAQAENRSMNHRKGVHDVVAHSAGCVECTFAEPPSSSSMVNVTGFFPAFFHRNEYIPALAAV